MNRVRYFLNSLKLPFLTPNSSQPTLSIIKIERPLEIGDTIYLQGQAYTIASKEFVYQRGWND